MQLIVGRDNTIIVNADDFGCNESVNRAIVESFSRGFVNSTTVMANMPGFKEAVDFAHQNKFPENIGVHLVLTDGYPLTKDIRKLHFLFNGNMKFQARLRNLFFLTKSEKDLIFREFSSQIERVLRNKIPITHLDTHHQIHDIWPVAEIMIQLLKKYKIPSMRILNNLDPSSGIHKRAYRGVINEYLFHKEVSFSNFLGNQIDFSIRKQKKPAFSKGGMVEVMVHPDFDEKGILVDKVNGIKFNFDFLKHYQVI